jgi:leader peptidase (prepilin peptidase)/N-methyltransferase
VSVVAGVGCAVLGLALGPYLAGLTVRLAADEPVLVAGAWRGVPAGRTRQIVVTLLSAIMAGAVGAGVGWDAALPAYLWLAFVGVALAVVDVDCQRLPNRLTLPSYPIAAALLAIASLARHDFGALLRGAIAGAAVYLVFLLLALISPASLGFGDVKLAGVLGLYLGWLGLGVLALGLVAAFALGALVAVTLLFGRRVGWRGDVAFGPSLLAGALFAVVAGQRLVDAYLTAMGLPPSS